MASVIYPDLAGALMPALQLRQQRENNALMLDRQSRLDAQNAEDRLEDRGLRREELEARREDRKAARDDRHLARISQLDAAQREKLKDFSTFQAHGGMAVLSAPPEQQPQAYATMLEQAKQRGYDMSLFPPQWDASTAARLKFSVDQSMPYAKYFENQNDRLTEMPAPGGAPASGDPLARSAGAIAGIESGGKYDAQGPMTGGDRAYGKYQVMGANVPTWTQEALGKPMTPQEFLANPQAQDAVFKHKFGQYTQKYGPEGAARAWFAGEGGMNNPGAKDVLGTSVADYGQKFAQSYGAGATGPGTAPAGAPPPVMTAQAPGGLEPSISGVPQGGGDPSGNPMQGTGPAPGKPALGQEVNAIRSQTRANGGDIFSRNGNPETKDGHYVVRSVQNPKVVVGMIPIKGKDPGTGGPLAGTGMDQQMMNILLTGDPATQQYAAAHAYMSKPRTTVDDQGRPITIQPMDMSVFGTPGYGRGGQPTGAPALPSGTTQTQIPGGGTLSVGESVAPKGPSAKEQADLRSARAEAETIIGALEKFRSAAGGQDLIDKGKSVMGMTTPANTAYNVAALLAKGEALFNLGVLNGPDLDIIRRTLPDPSTFKGASADKEATGQAIDQVIDLLKSRLTAKEKQMGGVSPQSSAGPTGPTTGAAGPKMSPQEAAKLPPGTPFIGMDGLPRVRN